MPIPSKTFHQPNLFETDLLLQLDPADPLLKLSTVIPRHEFDEAFGIHYTESTGAPGKPIRLMVGLLILKQLDNLSDEAVVLQWKRNPYYQSFCGMKEFQRKLPCHRTKLVHFRKCIGFGGVERIFRMSVGLHGKTALEDAVHIDTTVQEKNITYPTDSKLAIKTNRLNKTAKAHGVPQRRTLIKEVKSLRLDIRHFRHTGKRAKARRALKRLRIIAGILIREFGRKLPQYCSFERYPQDFLLYDRVKQQPKDTNKIYSLHDRHTLPEILRHVETSRGQNEVNEIKIIFPGKALKRDTHYQKDKKRKQCRRRAAIEPIIGHLKSDYRMARNYLKGAVGDQTNLLMAASPGI
ncbi:transposase, IS5 family [Nitrosomonas sp. Nm51]|uniref:transposase n=1 Tax=Nitrosomonas sp. Nm51 TaxID=133720 RepID=UPI0008BF2239|nr:transposase, IS5 family [Nitrosomonas sp. Nm51]